MSCTSFEYLVPAEYDGALLKVFLRRSCGLTARSLMILKHAEGGISRSGELIKATDIVHTGDVIRLTLPREDNEIIHVKGELDILYEDDYLLAINKPPFMPVHPTKIHQLDTLANIVAYYQKERGESYVFRALNRLDKDTSGIVLIAKDRLSYALVKDSTKKTYIAVCEGIVDEPGTIDLPIVLEKDSKVRRCVSRDGLSAVTHYEPVMHGHSHTMIKLWLETGRTHQIRCHMSAVGHPLAGDDLYGGSREFSKRQALHCHSVSFLHPVTKEHIFLNSDIPEAFYRIIKEG